MKGTRIAVIGGGISGLATARYLAGAPERPQVTLLEADGAPGGKVRTVDLGGFEVDTGPDAVLFRAEAVRELLFELGLDAEVQAPALRTAYLWSRGRLRVMPRGSVFGVPDRLLPLMTSGLVSGAGIARAGADLVLPRRPQGQDLSISQLLRPRFGRQICERLVEPLLCGVHAGRADVLSARSTVPEVEAIARDSRSIYLGLRRRAPAARPAEDGPPPPVLVTLRHGLGQLVQALRDDLPEGCLRTGTRAVALTRAGSGWVVSCGEGRPDLDVDAVVLATPAAATADLVEPLSADLARLLSGIRYAGVATVTLVHPLSGIARDLDATGFLVPPADGRFVVGCTWSTAKWPYLHNDRLAVVRCAVGRDGDQRWADLDDDALVAEVRSELEVAMGLTGPSERVLVTRWPGAMPQYAVGHAARLEEIDVEVAGLPGLALTGAAYRGSGLAGCITQARATARAVLDGLSAAEDGDGDGDGAAAGDGAR
ncbi:MAG: protoporphyrinogen oxidase [Actinomycetota bacterium]|nr:protoporphyrinogen oxidase [Actinomycetota bacterium]